MLLDFWTSDGEENVFVLVGENKVFADGSGLQTFPIPPDQRIAVRRRDVVGWRVEGGPSNLVGVIDYNNVEGKKQTFLTMTMEKPVIGNHVKFPYVTDRVYSVGVKYELQSQYFLEDYSYSRQKVGRKT